VGGRLTREALADAGYPSGRSTPSARAVIIGNAMGGEKHYVDQPAIQFPESRPSSDRSPTFARPAERGARRDPRRGARGALEPDMPPITEDTMPGELANVHRGPHRQPLRPPRPELHHRRGLRLGLAAMSARSRGSPEPRYDAAISGGIDRNMGVAAFVKFCKIGALSATGTGPTPTAPTGS
jgi:hypothetical protein